MKQIPEENMFGINVIWAVYFALKILYVSF